MNKKLIDWWNGSGVSYTSEYQAVLSRASAQGYTAPSGAQKVKQNTFLAALKTAGIYSELDLLYVFANDVTGNFWKLNWITPASYEATEPAGAVTKTSNAGIAGNGSSTYVSTNWIPGTNNVKYTLNDASVLMYVNNNVAEAKYACGLTAGGNEITIAPKWSDNNFYGCINAASANFNTYANASSIGFYQMTRAASNNMKLFKNGSQVDTETKNSLGIPAGGNSLWICARNASSFSTYQVGFFAVGSNLEAKASDFYTAWNAYFTSL